MPNANSNTADWINQQMTQQYPPQGQFGLGCFGLRSRIFYIFPLPKSPFFNHDHVKK